MDMQNYHVTDKMVGALPLCEHCREPMTIHSAQFTATKREIVFVCHPCASQGKNGSEPLQD